jgi:hypothetical protein
MVHSEGAEYGFDQADFDLFAESGMLIRKMRRREHDDTCHTHEAKKNHFLHVLASKQLGATFSYSYSITILGVGSQHAVVLISLFGTSLRLLLVVFSLSFCTSLLIAALVLEMNKVRKATRVVAIHWN